MFKVILSIFLTFILTGCVTTGQQLEVRETEVRYEKIPSYLTEPCQPEKLKKREEYLALKPHEKESYLTEYSISLLGTVKDCNIKLNKIDKLNGQLK